MSAELARLAAAAPAPPGPSPPPAGTGTAIEVERMVNATGLAGLAGAQVSVGYQLAGQRVTLRMDGTQMAVISQRRGPGADHALPGSPPVTGTGCAAPAGPRPARSRRPGR